MKKILYIALLIGISSLQAQKGKEFPSIKGTSLEDRQLTLPINNNKYSIIAIAFNQIAEQDLRKWLNPLYDNFIKKEKPSNFDIAELYDVNFAFVPVISGFKTVIKDFKKGTDKEFWQYIIDTEALDVRELKKQLSVTDDRIPYFFIVNAQGKIVEVQSGKFTDDKLEKLEDAIE